MARDDDPTEDFGRILESFERDREVQGAERPRGRLIRTEPTARPPEARPHIEVDDEDFATALAEFESGAPSVPAPRRVGAVVEGQVASIDLERALVDLGGKAEGSLATAELLDDEGVLRFEVGSTVRVEIVAEASSGPRLRLLGAGGRSAATAGARASVLEPGAIVEGRVAEVNKGGVLVEIGTRRAFCPFSQLDLRRVDNAETFVGRRLRFEILRAERGDLVVSRRRLLERERAEQAATLRAGLEVGAVVRGRVSALESYGAFVDLGGLEGLIHVSQLSHRRVEHPSELLRVGQDVEVRVETLETTREGRERVSLSMRALERDPWIDAMSTYAVGSIHAGTVRRLESFGAFIELAPGVDGLLPIGELGGGRRLSHPREATAVGHELTIRVIALDPAKRRLTLAPADATELPEARRAVREHLDRTADSTTGFGALGDFFKNG